jgi:penicillin-binding protein 1C
MSLKRSGWALVPYVVAVALVAGATGVRELDRAYPPPLERAEPVSAEVRDRNGELLRAFATSAGNWRLRPISTPSIQASCACCWLTRTGASSATWASIRWPWRAPPGSCCATAASCRAARPSPCSWRACWRGRRERTLTTKLVQMLRALQIEARLSKRQILELYLTLAPYGGNLEGTTAATLAYFGKAPVKLTPAEAALLVALPQLPEARRPDRHLRSRARGPRPGARAHGRRRRARRGGSRTGEAARLRAVRRNLPVHAAHLAQQAMQRAPAERVHRTTLDRTIQMALETLVRERAPDGRAAVRCHAARRPPDRRGRGACGLARHFRCAGAGATST